MQLENILGNRRIKTLTKFAREPDKLHCMLRRQFDSWLETAPPRVVKMFRDIMKAKFCETPADKILKDCETHKDMKRLDAYEINEDYIEQLEERRTLKHEINHNYTVVKMAEEIDFYLLAYLINEDKDVQKEWKIPKGIKAIISNIVELEDEYNGTIIDVVDEYLRDLVAEFKKTF